MRVKPIIAGTDGSEESLRAVEWAAREAVLRKEPLQIVTVPAPPGHVSPRLAAQQRMARAISQAAGDALAEAAKRATDTEPGLAFGTGLLEPGPPAWMLLHHAADASMLVLGSRGAGAFSAMLLGSASRFLATRAPCPVVIVREKTTALHRAIVVGIRDPGQSTAALSFAFEEAALHKAGLLAVHAWYWFLPAMRPSASATGGQRAAIGPRELSADSATQLEDMLAPWREKYPSVQTDWEVVHAQTARVLASESARADLVVLGRQRDGSGVGSVTHAMLSHARGPVAVVPATEHP